MQKIKFSGGDGSCMEKAVVVTGASSTFDGISAEKRWIWERFPGFEMTRQALLEENGKKYDLIEFVSASGEDVGIYFDITDFFGKPVI